jgi:hypothetical protein
MNISFVPENLQGISHFVTIAKNGFGNCRLGRWN